MFRTIPSDTWLASLAKTLNMRLNTQQGTGIGLIMLEADIEGVTDKRAMAYILGTCYHECRFKSIPEIRAKAGTDIRRMQDRYWPSGYYGRGYAQLTWRDNYKLFSPIVERNLVQNPDLMLLPEIGAKVLVVGMNRGLFGHGTNKGVGLPAYFTDATYRPRNWLLARKIVNGSFQAKYVADAALKILPLL